MIAPTAEEESPIWFKLPDSFVPMGLDRTPEQRMPQLLDALHSLGGPQVSDEAALRIAMAQEAALKAMWDQGVRYAATCLLRGGDDENPRLTTGQFTVAIHLADLAGENSLETLEKSFRLPGKKRETAIDDLPTGKALLVADETRSVLPAEVFGAEEDTVHTVRQLQAFIPLPDGNRIASLALGTESLEDWADYTALMREILATVSFRRPGVTSAIEDRLGGF